MASPPDDTSADREQLSRRSAREVVDDHLHQRERGDLEQDLARNYDEDVVIITSRRVVHGHDGVRDQAGLLYQAIQDASTYEYKTVRADDRMAFLEWSATGDTMAIMDGVDSFLIEGGLIRAQTIRYTVTFSDISEARGIG